jgi:hypothetical protein
VEDPLSADVISVHNKKQTGYGRKMRANIYSKDNAVLINVFRFFPFDSSQ